MRFAAVFAARQINEHDHIRGHERLSAFVAGGMKTPFLLDRFPGIDETKLQDPINVALAVRWMLQQPEGTVVPEMTVLPMRESSWP